MSIVPVAIMPSFYYGEYIMANTATVATSAVAVSVETISGFDSIDSARETLFTIGSETFLAERAMARGKEALDVLDANLNDIVKDLSYVEFMKVREFHVAGGVDLLDSVDASQKRWERQINRCVSTFNFVRPKSESKDAVRKAEAKEKAVAAMAMVRDELEQRTESAIERWGLAGCRALSPIYGLNLDQMFTRSWRNPTPSLRRPP